MRRPAVAAAVFPPLAWLASTAPGRDLSIMIFSSVEFLLFFAVVLLVYWCVLGLVPEPRRNTLRHRFLLVASAYFYMSWNAKLVLLVYFSILVDYFCGLQIESSASPGRRRLFLVVSIVSNLGMLMVFKYTNFFLDNVNHVAGLFGRPTAYHVNLLLPVGISFHTFQSISYTTSVYRGQFKAIRNFADVALYVSFFPQLVAGPIVRAHEFVPQMERPARFRDVNVRRAANLFLLGLIKKVVISDRIAVVSDAMFASPAAYDGAGAWIGVVAYAIQIYCDFSGYTDMALGSACLLGYELPVNFNMPYLAHNIADFWRRWHISLSTWLRDYLYVPLGGNRGGRLLTYRNLMLTMLLGGLWHGASWTFMAWGGLHGLALIAHKELRRRFPEPLARSQTARTATGILAAATTFAFVCFTWVFFRAPSFGDAWLIVRKMCFLAPGGTHEVKAGFVVLVLLMILGHWAGTRAFDRLERGAPWARLPGMEAFAYATVIYLLLLVAPDGTQPFIYFQF